MSLRRSSVRFCLGAAALALGAASVCSAQSGSRQRGRPIEFSAPRSGEVTTNLNQLTSKKDSLKQLEEDLYAPLQSFSPKSSLEGVVARPPRSPAPSALQSKRIKELLERRKNWVFMTPEDLLEGPTVEQILKAPEYGPDGQEKKQVSAMERYYESLMSKRSAKKNRTQEDDDQLFSPPKKPDPTGISPDRDDSDLPSGLKESADALRTLFEEPDGSSPYLRTATPASLSDPFGLARTKPTEQQTKEYKKRMDDYRSLLDPSWRPPAPVNALASPLSPLGPRDDSPFATKPATGLPAVSSSTPRKGLEAQLDVLHPKLGPPELPDLNAQALGQTRPELSLPKVPERKVAMPAPVFTAPKRAF